MGERVRGAGVRRRLRRRGEWQSKRWLILIREREDEVIGISVNNVIITW